MACARQQMAAVACSSAARLPTRQSSAYWAAGRHPLRAAAERQQRRQRHAAAARGRGAGSVRAQALRNIDWPQALLFDCDGVRPTCLAGALPQRCHHATASTPPLLSLSPRSSRLLLPHLFAGAGAG
jgi:hypothetical protein